ncbi:MAG: DUF2130 domain-containing protein, partial [Gammaproteobacteria bacterium]|nr:DUF2130 domain-containing protein [Gammaproteobacteria bacterium]
MHDITCPHCHTAFKIDESGYAEIARQIRDQEFDRQLHQSLEIAEAEKRNAVELAQMSTERRWEGLTAAKEREIHDLRTELRVYQVSRQLEITQAVAQIEKERDGIRSALEKA